MDPIVVTELRGAEARERLADLAAVLADAVAGGASVNFMAGLDAERAAAFWQGQFPRIDDGSRRLFVALVGGRVVGTVVLSLAPQPNAPHRADIGKMLVHSSMRRRGLGRRLLATAEEAALAAGRTLLMLDTETGSAGEALYRGAGWTAFGVVPGHSFRPHGVLAPTTFFYKWLDSPPTEHPCP
ncbi:GNAT family N-acetyltransferase [Methylobrevis pamukkalensis]|nr:GNAT family N-acetyltransferase [Methylobrevis pamukkalensis]